MFLRVVELANEDSDANADQEQLQRVSRMTEIEDLQAPRVPPLAQLCIKVKNKNLLAVF